MLVIRWRRDVPIPDFVLRRIERRLEQAQVRVEFGRSAFDPGGVLLLEHVKFFAAGIPDAMAEARAIRVRFNPWLLAAGYFELHDLVLEDGRIVCPAQLSPTGTGRPLVDRLRFEAVRQDAGWKFSGVDGLLGGVRVHAAVEVADVGGAAAAPIDSGRWLAEVLQGERLAARWLGELDRCEQPRLELTLRVPSRDRLAATLAATAARVELPGGIEVLDVGVQTSAAGEFVAGELALPLEIRLREAKCPQGWGARDVLLTTELRLRSSAVPELPAAAVLTATDVQAPEDVLGYARLAVHREGAHRGRFRLDGLHEAGAVRLTGSGDVSAGAGTLRLEARLSPEPLNEIVARVATWRKSQFLEKLTFESPAAVAATAQLSAGWKLARADAAVQVGAAVASGVPLRSARAEVAFADGQLDVQRIVLQQGESEVRGSYTMDVATRDYRFLLGGHVFPEGISPWFHEWWPRLWRDFEFRGPPPLADVDVRGRWFSPDLSVVAGRMIAAPLILRGVPLERADVFYFIRPEHYDIVRFDARRGAQRAAGTFTRRDDPETHQPQRIDFDFASNLPLAEGAVFFGPEGRETVEPYVFAQAPEVEARGRIDWRDGHPSEAISARVRSTGEFRFNGFPVENARFAFTLRDNDIDLPELTADLAGGKLQGKAGVTGPAQARRLSFTGSLLGADLTRTVNTWNAFRASTGDAAATAHSASVASNLGTRGRLDLELAAAGPLENLMGLRGTGRAHIVGAELGQVQMLGFLSRLLQGSLFGFTSLRFTNAEAAFAVEETELNFSKLTFTGPSSRLEGKGRYRMPDEKLDFHVSLRPFRESDFALANLIGIVLEPIARVLEVKLTGTLAHPDWAFAAGPSNFFRNTEKPVTAPFVAPPPAVPSVKPAAAAPAPASAPPAH